MFSAKRFQTLARLRIRKLAQGNIDIKKLLSTNCEIARRNICRHFQIRLIKDATDFSPCDCQFSVCVLLLHRENGLIFSLLLLRVAFNFRQFSHRKMWRRKFVQRFSNFVSKIKNWIFVDLFLEKIETFFPKDLKFFSIFIFPKYLPTNNRSIIVLSLIFRGIMSC